MSYTPSGQWPLTLIAKATNYTAAVGDYVAANTTSRTVVDGVTTNASTTITSATAAFTGADVGRQIDVDNYVPVGTFIASVTNSTTAVLSAAATATTTGLGVVIGMTVKITLPVLTGSQPIAVQNNGPGIVLIVPTSGTINGAASLSISNPYQTLQFTGDGTNLFTVNDPYASTRLEASNDYSINPTKIRNLRAGLAKAATGGTAVLGFVGTSISAGYLVGRKNAYPYRLCASALPTLGIPFAGAYLGINGYGTANEETRYTYAGGFADASFLLAETNVAGATITFVSDTPGTIVEVIYPNQFGSFTVAIDGGAAVTVTTTGGFTLAKYVVTGLANTVHTVVVTNPANVYVHISTIGVFASSGLRMINIGADGTAQPDWSAGGETAFDKRIQVMKFLGVNAVFEEFMANEDASTAAHTARSNYLISTLAASNADTILLATQTHAANTVRDAAGAANIKAIGQANQVPVVDMYGRWGPYTASRGLYQDTDIHPSPAGNADYVAAIMKILNS